jgi:hypothetical protein
LRCLHGAHDRGIRFLFRTTLKWPSGEWGLLPDVVEGGVGVIVESRRYASECDANAPIPVEIDALSGAKGPRLKNPEAECPSSRLSVLAVR